MVDNSENSVIDGSTSNNILILVVVITKMRISYHTVSSIICPIFSEFLKRNCENIGHIVLTTV